MLPERRPTPAPYTLHHTPCILPPTPYPLHPTPYTLHHTPCILPPTPCALHPAPFTDSLYSNNSDCETETRKERGQEACVKKLA